MPIAKRHLKYIDKARKCALSSNFKRARVGCVAVYNNRIIASGCNSTKTHPIQREFNRRNIYPIGTQTDFINTLHAEVDCLGKFVHENTDIDWHRVTLYLYRVTRKYPYYGLARPCSGCMKLIRQLGIKDVYYTGNNSIIYENIQYDIIKNMSNDIL